MENIKELTPEQQKTIIKAYIQPAKRLRQVIDRLRATGIPFRVATTYLFVKHFIGYDDKLMLDRMEEGI